MPLKLIVKCHLFICMSNLGTVYFPHRGILGDVQEKYKNIKTVYKYSIWRQS